MDDKLRQRIAGLLAQAEHPNTSEVERLAYTERAQELMIKHSISRAMIDDAAPSGENVVRVDVHFTTIYSESWAGMGAYVAGAFDLVGIRLNMGSKTSWGLAIVGFETDALDAKQLIDSLRVQCDNAMSAWWKAYDKTGLTAMDKFVARRSFINAFGVGAAERIRIQRQTVVDDTPGAALVLFDRKKLAEQWVRENMRTKLSKAQRMAADAVAQGKAAGRNADVNAPRAGSTTRAAVR